MQVQAQPGTPPAHHSPLRSQNLIHVGVAFEDCAEALLYRDGHAQVGPRLFENVERGWRKHAVTQRPEPDNRDPAAPRQTFQDTSHGALFFYLGFVDQHHRNVVANRVDAVTLDAFQAALITLEFDRSLADGAHKDFQQIFADSHSETFSLTGEPRHSPAPLSPCFRPCDLLLSSTAALQTGHTRISSKSLLIAIVKHSV